MHLKKTMTAFNTRLFSSLFLVLVAASLLNTQMAQACSRVLWNTHDEQVIVGRSMDWQHKFDDWIFVLPRGQVMTGGEVNNSLKWTSKYGSVVTTVSGYAKKLGFDWVKDGATEGINEKGLTAHLLFLEASKYPEVDDRPAVSYMRWVRYLLDNHATVEEAVAGMKKIRIEAVKFGDSELGVHVAIEDPSGDSAIIEFIDGKLKVDHGKEFRVMTNDPIYAKQLENLKQYREFGGKKAIPGETASEDRFVRLSFYSKYLPKPKDSSEAAASMLSLIMNVAVPFGAPYGSGVYPTWWTSVIDLTNKIYYFNWVQSPNVIWFELKNFDFSQGKPVLQLNPRNPSLVGEVSGAFEPVESGK